MPGHASADLHNRLKFSLPTRESQSLDKILLFRIQKTNIEPLVFSQIKVGAHVTASKDAARHGMECTVSDPALIKIRLRKFGLSLRILPVDYLGADF